MKTFYYSLFPSTPIKIPVTLSLLVILIIIAHYVFKLGNEDYSVNLITGIICIAITVLIIDQQLKKRWSTTESIISWQIRRNLTKFAHELIILFKIKDSFKPEEEMSWFLFLNKLKEKCTYQKDETFSNAFTYDVQSKLKQILRSEIETLDEELALLGLSANPIILSDVFELRYYINETFERIDESKKRFDIPFIQNIAVFQSLESLIDTMMKVEKTLTEISREWGQNLIRKSQARLRNISKNKPS